MSSTCSDSFIRSAGLAITLLLPNKVCGTGGAAASVNSIAKNVFIYPSRLLRPSLIVAVDQSAAAVSQLCFEVREGSLIFLMIWNILGELNLQPWGQLMDASFRGDTFIGHHLCCPATLIWESLISARLLSYLLLLEGFPKSRAGKYL